MFALQLLAAFQNTRLSTAFAQAEKVVKDAWKSETYSVSLHKLFPIRYFKHGGIVRPLPVSLKMDVESPIRIIEAIRIIESH